MVILTTFVAMLGVCVVLRLDGNQNDRRHKLAHVFTKLF